VLEVEHLYQGLIRYLTQLHLLAVAGVQRQVETPQTRVARVVVAAVKIHQTPALLVILHRLIQAKVMVGVLVDFMVHPHKEAGEEAAAQLIPVPMQIQEMEMLEVVEMELQVLFLV
jgi:hypothetical protein